MSIESLARADEALLTAVPAPTTTVHTPTSECVSGS